MSHNHINYNNRYRLEPLKPRGLIGWYKFNETAGVLVNAYKYNSGTEAPIGPGL